MLRTASLILLTIVVAVTGGAASVAYVLDSELKFGAVTVGPWTAYPEAGTQDSDPYAKAEAAIDGSLALGRSEGLAFTAETDSDGAVLDASCTYVLHGQTPTTRFWTLHADAGEERASASAAGNASRRYLQSRAVLRNPDNTLDVTVGPRPVPGNWLRVDREGELALVLTIYDAPVSSSLAADAPDMPTIRKVACNG